MKFLLVIHFSLSIALGHKGLPLLRWPEPIYMRVGCVFESRFSEEMIQPISTIFGIRKKECATLKKGFF